MENLDLDSFVIDLPGYISNELSKILNDNKTWERLASTMPYFTSRDISELQQASYSYMNSPGQQLLKTIGCSLTVRQLAKYLDELQLESALMLLLPFESLTITRQPRSYLAVDEGENSHIILHCEAIGFPYPQYQWYKLVDVVNNKYVELITQQSSTLDICPVRLDDEGIYGCLIYNCNDTSFTDWTKVVVHPTPSYPFVNQSPIKLEILHHPQASSDEMSVGGSVLLNCEAKGTPPLSYTWYKDGLPIPGANKSEYKWINVQPENNKASWRFQCKVSDAYEHLMSKEAFINLKISRNTEMYTAEDKVALLIGNSDYTTLIKLHSPSEDVVTLANELAKNDFKVISFCNLNFLEMKTAVHLFSELLDKGVYALFYYVGHGFKFNGQNYMLPIDADKNYQVSETLCSEYVLKLMQDRKTAFNVFFLDMCLKEPEGNIDRSQDKIEEYKPEVFPNTIYFFATTKHCSAYEETKAPNGIFMKHLKKFLNINQPLHEVIELVKEEIDKDVVARHKQFPWSEGNCRYPYSLLNKTVPSDKEQYSERTEKYQRLFSLPNGFTAQLSSGRATVSYGFLKGLILNSIFVNIKICHDCSVDFPYLPCFQLINKDITYSCHLLQKSCNDTTWQINIYNLQKLKEPFKATLKIKKRDRHNSSESCEEFIALYLELPLRQFWKLVVPVEQEEPLILSPMQEKEETYIPFNRQNSCIALSDNQDQCTLSTECNTSDDEGIIRCVCQSSGL